MIDFVIYILLIIVLCVGLVMLVGVLLGCVEWVFFVWLDEELCYGIFVMGVGVLMFVVVLVLVFEGVKVFSVIVVSVSFFIGFLVFMGLDIWLVKY